LTCDPQRCSARRLDRGAERSNGINELLVVATDLEADMAWRNASGSSAISYPRVRGPDQDGRRSDRSPRGLICEHAQCLPIIGRSWRSRC
jgi:hypothetical protein